mgnify:CR=1 FL=1|jgi:hypothetical protein
MAVPKAPEDLRDRRVTISVSDNELLAINKARYRDKVKARSRWMREAVMRSAILPPDKPGETGQKKLIRLAQELSELSDRDWQTVEGLVNPELDAETTGSASGSDSDTDD